MNRSGDIAQYWLADLVPAPRDHDLLTCPRCGAQKFTAERRAYGVELACWECPTYIGIRARDPVPGNTPRTPRRRRGLARLWPASRVP